MSVLADFMVPPVTCRVLRHVTAMAADQIGTWWTNGIGWSDYENEPILIVQAQASCKAGAAQTYTGLKLETSSFHSYDRGDVSWAGQLNIVRRNQGPRSQLRMLPPDRKVPDSLPVFHYDEYRWREDEQASKEIVPANWDIDLTKFEESVFSSGICTDPDLEVVGLEKINELNEIHPVIRGSEYFIGPERSYRPAHLSVPRH
jgi:hypothetical protein